MRSIDALADPVRLRIVRHLAVSGPATLQELAAAATVHVNTARAHVVALVEAGHLEREAGTPRGRGRPPARYRLTEGWTPPTSDFRGLAELLGAVLVRRGARPAELRQIGIEWGRYLLGRPGEHDVPRELPLALERLGFRAELADGELALSACPCPLVAPDRPGLICDLAIAVTDGLLMGAGSGLRVRRRFHDPERRSCRAVLEKERG